MSSRELKVTCYFSNGDEYDYDLCDEGSALNMLGLLEFEFSIGEREVVIRRSVKEAMGDDER